MTTDSLLKNIARHITLNPEEADLFGSLITYSELSKKEFFLREGAPCNKICYIHSGALRAYCIDKEGKEATIMFAVADWWVTDMYCFVNQKPAMMYVEAIEPSCVFQLSKESFDTLFLQIPKFERFFRILMQNAYTREQLRTIETLSLPAEKRYVNFITKYPYIVDTVTQKQIASYLGITPEFLSTIRRKLARH